MLAAPQSELFQEGGSIQIQRWLVMPNSPRPEFYEWLNLAKTDRPRFVGFVSSQRRLVSCDSGCEASRGIGSAAANSLYWRKSCFNRLLLQCTFSFEKSVPAVLVRARAPARTGRKLEPLAACARQLVCPTPLLLAIHPLRLVARRPSQRARSCTAKSPNFGCRI